LWVHKFEVEDSIKTVRIKFAKMFGLHPNSCQLYYNSDQLADQPIRQACLMLFPLCTVFRCKSPRCK